MSATTRPSYRACFEAGMTQAETATARGVCKTSVYGWAKRNSVTFAPGRNDAYRAAFTKRMRDLQNDPAYRAAQLKRAHAHAQDPKVIAAYARARATRYPYLTGMSADQRADYDVFRRKGYGVKGALAMLGLAVAA